MSRTIRSALPSVIYCVVRLRLPRVPSRRCPPIKASLSARSRRMSRTVVFDEALWFGLASLARIDEHTRWTGIRAPPKRRVPRTSSYVPRDSLHYVLECPTILQACSYWCHLSLRPCSAALYCRASSPLSLRSTLCSVVRECEPETEQIGICQTR